MIRSSLFVIVPAALLVVIGCDLADLDPGGGAVSTTSVTLRSGARPDVEEIIIDPDKPPAEGSGPGTISGVIKLAGSFGGLPPKQRKGTAKDPAVCGKDADIPDETMIVGEGNGIKNVFVYLDLKKAPPGTPEPEAGKIFDQKGCIFSSHAFLVREGTEFEVKNSDAVAHNVHGFPKLQAQPNFAMDPNSSSTLTFKKAEGAPFQMKCDIHPWMEAWALVLKHPYAAVTDDTGAFTIPDVPSGNYTVRIWHERSGQLERAKLTVTVGGTAELNREFPTTQFKL